MSAPAEAWAMFQSSSYWRMAEKVYTVNIAYKGQMCFNPHHTGEWLKRLTLAIVSLAPTVFQSSSYWRMAEKFSGQLVD